jgi:hypothetical protein
MVQKLIFLLFLKAFLDKLCKAGSLVTDKITRSALLVNRHHDPSRGPGFESQVSHFFTSFFGGQEKPKIPRSAPTLAKIPKSPAQLPTLAKIPPLSQMPHKSKFPAQLPTLAKIEIPPPTRRWRRRWRRRRPAEAEAAYGGSASAEQVGVLLGSGSPRRPPLHHEPLSMTSPSRRRAPPHLQVCTPFLSPLSIYSSPPPVCCMNKIGTALHCLKLELLYKI